jgi:prepilin-type N-terminal cleavage/methylation domain-containing protein
MTLTTTRRGFSMIELLLTLVIFGFIATMAMARIGGVISRAKVDQAATVVAADLELAFSTAGRLRQPVILRSDFANKSYRLNDRVGAQTLRFQRSLGPETQYTVDSVRFVPDTVVVLPPGRGSNPIQATIYAKGKVRRVTMSTAGFVRIVTP